MSYEMLMVQGLSQYDVVNDDFAAKTLHLVAPSVI